MLICDLAIGEQAQPRRRSLLLPFQHPNEMPNRRRLCFVVGLLDLDRWIAEKLDPNNNFNDIPIRFRSCSSLTSANESPRLLECEEKAKAETKAKCSLERVAKPIRRRRAAKPLPFSFSSNSFVRSFVQRSREPKRPLSPF